MLVSLGVAKIVWQVSQLKLDELFQTYELAPIALSSMESPKQIIEPGAWMEISGRGNKVMKSESDALQTPSVAVM